LSFEFQDGTILLDSLIVPLSNFCSIRPGIEESVVSLTGANTCNNDSNSEKKIEKALHRV
jgi:hypothetical protein